MNLGLICMISFRRSTQERKMTKSYQLLHSRDAMKHLWEPSKYAKISIGRITTEMEAQKLMVLSNYTVLMVVYTYLKTKRFLNYSSEIR